MKRLSLETAAFRYIEKSFSQWLDVLGYSWQSVYGMPICIREMLHHFENNGITSIRQIDNGAIRAYYRQLKMRPNLRRGGGLSAAHLNKHLQAIHRFSDHLRQTGKLTLPKLHIPKEELPERRIKVLTGDEVAQLYRAAGDHDGGMWAGPTAARDRAMLSVFYGCGLRRNEGHHLNVDDINFDRRVLHVRKGKNYRERLVPFTRADGRHLQQWVHDHRPKLVRDRKEEAFFISMMHRRMTGQALLVRLKVLVRRTGDSGLQEKDPGLHTLRHSVATHLLEAGMQLEHIARFLGHASLESTQIYTHLKEEQWDRER